MASKKKKTRRSTQDQNKSTVCEIDKLPYEIIFNVLLKLPIPSVLQCRCVCKSWLTIVHDPLFAYAHLARPTAATTRPRPSIVLWSRTLPSPNKMHFLDPYKFKIFNEITWIPKSRVGPWIPKIEIIGSCNGLICLSQPFETTAPVYVCNPLTGQYMALPQSTHYPSRRRAVSGFGFAANSKEYKVVRMLSSGEDHLAGVGRSHVEVYTLGTRCWRKKGTIPYRLVNNTRLNTFLNGALHWISMNVHDHDDPMLDSVIVSFNLGDEEFGEIPLPEFDLINDDTHNRHVGVIGGCLSIHNYSRQGCIDIWVMKDYGVKESWSRYFIFSEERYFFPLVIRKNGKAILGYWRGKLVTYDLRREEFTDLQLDGVPNFSQVYPHVPSFITLESACGGEKMSRREMRRIKPRMMR